MEQQGPPLSTDFSKVRFGNRQVRREPLQVSYLGQPVPAPANPTRPRPKDRRKPPPEPGYERFQLRLW
jgi:hypothetical protein